MGYHERFDVAGMLEDIFRSDSKPDDGMLHPSGDLTGCEIAMCHKFDPAIPMNPKSYQSVRTLKIGTLVHEHIEAHLTGDRWEEFEFRCEVDMTPGLPKGWKGTADVLAGRIGTGHQINDPNPWWTLLDWKTMDGQALRYKDFTVVDEGYHYQTSSYYWSAEAMGYRMAPEICLTYIPITKCKGFDDRPIEQWFEPLPKKQVWGRMAQRKKLRDRYLAGEHDLPQQMPKISKTRRRGSTVEQIEAPHWLIPFCNSSQCKCAGQTVEVVGYEDNDVPEVL